MGDERTYNVEDRIRELGEDPQTAYANASANGMAGDAPPPTALPADPFPSVNPFAAKGADPSAADEPPPPPTSGKAGSAPVMAPRPAPPKLAPIVDTGTLADTQEKMPELVGVRPTAAPIEPAASFGDLFSANENIAERSSSLFDEKMLHDGYSPIVRALGLDPSENPANFNQVDAAGEARFGSVASVSKLATAAKQGDTLLGNVYMADRPLQEYLVADQIKARRAKDPNFLPGVPDTVDGLHKYFADQQKQGEAADQAVIARSPGGLTGFGAALAGSTVGTMHDPINLMALAIPGGEGKTLLQIAARDAIINGVLEFAQQPIAAHNKAELGESYTATDAATNVASAAIGGAVLGPALHIGGKAIAATGLPQAIGGAVGSTVGTVGGLFKALPEAVRTKWAGRAADGAPVGSFFSSLDNRELAEFARDASAGKLTPDQSAAANVIERAQEVGESSPYQPGPVGDGTHEGALAMAIKDLEDRRTPEAAGLPSGPAADGAEVASPAATLERPPTPSTVGRPQPSTDVESAIASFTPKVYHAENATGNVNAKNPHSSASGPAQFTDGTFRDYYRKVYGQDPGEHPAQELKNNPEVQGRLLNALTRDNAAKLQSLHEPLNDGNLYVMHVFGAHDGEKIFKADPSTPIDELLSAKAISGNRLEGKSASEVIAWAHGRMGVPHVAAVRASAGPLEAASEDPTVAQLNSDALQLDNAVIGSDAQSSTWSPPTDTDAAVAATQPVPPMYARSYPAREINVDADRFQFKAGGDQQGVTDRLNGVSQWNPLYAGRIVTWEDQAGRVFVADGHQRVGLANRLERQGHPPISMDAITLREADGVSAEDARTYAALKNIAEGTGTSIDAAKVIRDAGPHVLDHLPPKSALVRDGGALARLSDRAFGAVYNDVVPADFAAVIGHLLPHQPEAHEAMIDLLAKLDPANRGQAESIVRQAMAAGIHKEEQVDLFGTHEHVTSLMLEKAKITERVLAQLRKMRLVHRTAAEGADALEAAGSTIARERSAEEAQANAQAIETVNRLAYRAGPVSDAITAAARELKSGGQLGSLARTAAERIRELDLADLGRDAADGSDVGALAGETAVDHANGANIDGAGRGGDAGEEGPQSSAEHGDQEQPSLLELEHATERFSDPDGKAVQQQADSLVHDLNATVSRRDQIRAATEALKDTKPGELRAVEPFAKDEPGYHRFRYVAEDGTAVGGSYTVDGDTIENLNIGDMSNKADLGPAQLRAMLEQLHEQNPDVRFVHGYRKSGGRKAVGSGEKDVWFEFTDKGAKFHGDKDPRLGAFERERETTSAVGLGALMHGGEEGELAGWHWRRENDPEGDWIIVSKPGEKGEYPLPIDWLIDQQLPKLRAGAATDGSIEAGDLAKILDHADTLDATGNPKGAPAEDRYPKIDHAAAEAAPEAEARRIAVELARRKMIDNAGMGDGYKWDDSGLNSIDGKRPPKGTVTIELDGAPGRPKFAFKLSDIRKEAEATLDLGAKEDPAIFERQRQELELKAGSPMRSIEEQHGTMGLGLFDHSDQPDLTFRIGEEGGEVTAADLLKDLEEDDKAIKAIKDCL